MMKTFVEVLVSRFVDAKVEILMSNKTNNFVPINAQRFAVTLDGRLLTFIN